MKDINAIQAKELIEKKQDDETVLVIDIRTPSEFNFGHIKNAININYYDANFEDKLNKIEKNKTILYYCNSGSRSSDAKPILESMNFKSVYHMEHGILEWQQNNYQLEQ